MSILPENRSSDTLQKSDSPTAASVAADLPALAIAINSEHALAEQYASMAIHRAKRAGELLNQAKAKVSHGEWLPWLSANCPTIATRTAQAYMKLDREWGTLESKCATVAHLTVSDALKLLAEPKPDTLTADEQRKLDSCERRINESLSSLESCMSAIADGVRKMRDGIGSHFGGFDNWCSQEIGLDPALRDMLLDPSRSWNCRDMDDEQHTLMLCWMLRTKGFSDTEARAILATQGPRP